jgi:hypothetical protein
MNDYIYKNMLSNKIDLEEESKEAKRVLYEELVFKVPIEVNNQMEKTNEFISK